MTPKLIADYVELANKYLDQIPVEKTSDFEVITEALKTITENKPVSSLPETLKGRISEIKDIIDNPDIYVAKKENYQEFKNIILNRVAGKIKEFSLLKPEEKEAYIANQAMAGNQRQQNQNVMSQYKPPSEDSEKHTISEQQMLEEQQRQYQDEGPELDVERLRNRLTGARYSTASEGFRRNLEANEGIRHLMEDMDIPYENPADTPEEENQIEVEREAEREVEVQDDQNINRLRSRLLGPHANDQGWRRQLMEDQGIYQEESESDNEIEEGEENEVEQERERGIQEDNETEET
jgi:hypothetical protein